MGSALAHLGQLLKVEFESLVNLIQYIMPQLVTNGGGKTLHLYPKKTEFILALLSESCEKPEAAGGLRL
ncbi:MAG: hypothetical protein SWJ54_09620 [Cyanobacteriota bacterium]|nr:hypothetical protein [Cyanobacteriota bacterium]